MKTTNEQERARRDIELQESIRKINEFEYSLIPLETEKQELEYFLSLLNDEYEEYKVISDKKMKLKEKYTKQLKQVNRELKLKKIQNKSEL